MELNDPSTDHVITFIEHCIVFILPFTKFTISSLQTFFYFDSALHRSIFQCAQLLQCQGYRSIVLNMPESYNGLKKIHLEASKMS